MTDRIGWQNSFGRILHVFLRGYVHDKPRICERVDSGVFRFVRLSEESSLSVGQYW